MSTQWVPLHVHSQFSILDALPTVEEIAAKAKEYGFPACALTDHGNLHGAVDFVKACKGIKPIIGCELYVAPGPRNLKKKEYGEKAAYHITLLAKNKTGYNNLCKLSSIGFLEGFYYFPRIDKELLAKHAEGLICLSGPLQTLIGEKALSGDEEALIQEVRWHQELFGEDFYLELMRHPMTDESMRADGMHLESWLQQQYADFIARESKVNTALAAVGNKLGIKLVATNDSH